ncbi:hypothetical protein QFZ32_008995 [Streptomyces canus]|nr:hypothetical protein [Streptomyces canus]MDQ1073467.1 hypothetical protein [Streptomyces canus]
MTGFGAVDALLAKGKQEVPLRPIEEGRAGSVVGAGVDGR